MRRFVTLSEMIEELQKYEAEHGHKQIRSIGTSSGSNGSYLFNLDQDYETEIKVKTIRDNK